MQVALALQIVRFGEMLEEMLEELLPNRITEYAYELANLFNTFYTECKARRLHQTAGTHVMVGAHQWRQECYEADKMKRIRPAGGGQPAGGVAPAAVRGHRSHHAAVLCPAGHQAAVQDMKWTRVEQDWGPSLQNPAVVLQNE